MNIKLNFLAKFIIIGFYAYSLKSFSFLESSNISPKVIIPPLESWCLPNYLPFQNNLPGQGVINGCFRGFYRKHNIFPNITDHEGRGLKLGWEKYMHLFDSPHFLQKKVYNFIQCYSRIVYLHMHVHEILQVCFAILENIFK